MISTAKNNFSEDKPHRLNLDVGDAVIISGECANWYYGYKKTSVFQSKKKTITNSFRDLDLEINAFYCFIFSLHFYMDI